MLSTQRVRRSTVRESAATGSRTGAVHVGWEQTLALGHYWLETVHWLKKQTTAYIGTWGYRKKRSQFWGRIAPGFAAKLVWLGGGHSIIWLAMIELEGASSGSLPLPEHCPAPRRLLFTEYRFRTSPGRFIRPLEFVTIATPIASRRSHAINSRWAESNLPSNVALGPGTIPANEQRSRDTRHNYFPGRKNIFFSIHYYYFKNIFIFKCFGDSRLVIFFGCTFFSLTYTGNQNCGNVKSPVFVVRRSHVVHTRTRHRVGDDWFTELGIHPVPSNPVHGLIVCTRMPLLAVKTREVLIHKTPHVIETNTNCPLMILTRCVKSLCMYYSTFCLNV